jgi:hypothetical protein
MKPFFVSKEDLEYLITFNYTDICVEAFDGGNYFIHIKIYFNNDRRLRHLKTLLLGKIS